MDKRQLLVDSFKIEDDLGVVIRSQIIIEQYLNEIIESVLLHPEKYRKEINLDYHVKVKFVVALGLDKRFESILNVLGTLRNDFAHNLRCEISKQDANNIYKSLDEERKNTVQELYKNIKSRLSDLNLPKYTNLVPKDKYILYVIALCGALEVACELLPNKKIN
ncbi:hypothetical protein Q8W30_17430 [Neptunomonas phycophila]|uniref:Mannitol repressor n=1 Tax=Neptunomonas phycophila TaxID=1572645 RepID=A0ABT9EZ84_9GAMM|nr:hypothetical protein [Neptunomonas phycophila]MDP2524349.1 hypothetical protein [Neptunomonas phycophila]